jgi:hypothetical protein
MKAKSLVSASLAQSGCLGLYLARHRGRLTIATPVETPNMPQIYKVRKRVSRAGEVAEQRFERSIGLFW